jgi:uncharacterized protein (DUF4415 family)
MSGNDKTTKPPAAEPDIKPELDEAWFEEADAFVGAKLVRRGRPKSADPKLPVSLRLDREVIEWFKSKGEGWQTRINEELRKVAGL